MPKKELVVTINEIKSCKQDVFLLSFISPFIAKYAKPGMFLQVKVPKTILRRPLSIHKIQGNKVYLLFRVRGRGTKILSQHKVGNKLNIIGPLGNGFCLKSKAKRYILVAGGLGVAPLMFLAQRLARQKKEIIVILGAKSGKDILLAKEFSSLGCKFYITTEDGLKGKKGLVTDILKEIFAQDKDVYHIYACGPEIMFKEINKIIQNYPQVSCEVSFEQFMGCGLGICCGCSIETKYGYKKVCSDGPVFNIKDIW